ncbi:hypothetical protein PoB_000681800 [Plakobranchus ocellatus]|uniref:Uncharacterized protein n=1 Tax=Plakobranchus ocellatus TaxID=259542 RepID=A0AAV3YCT9_9GAST|nr:hypothetical protein PoB_000681800 [Plakobranchus ocellatus]
MDAETGVNTRSDGRTGYNTRQTGSFCRCPGDRSTSELDPTFSLPLSLSFSHGKSSRRIPCTSVALDSLPDSSNFTATTTTTTSITTTTSTEATAA